MRNPINRIRYRLWQLNCSRVEWYARCWTALVDEGYGNGATDGDAAMYRYWYENIRTTPPTKETTPCGS